MKEEIKNHIIKHNQICIDLENKGYTIQGCGNDFGKCYFSKGNIPYSKIVGYIDWNTLQVVYL